MSLSIDMALQRICSAREEGFRRFPYDDATGIRVRAPQGHVTWLYGCNLDTEGTPELGQSIVRFKLTKLQGDLALRPWYTDANDARQSVFLDIAFNQGLGGLLDYPSMIHFASVGDWTNASVQCSVKPESPAGVIARYKYLADILLSGVDRNYVP